MTATTEFVHYVYTCIAQPRIFLGHNFSKSLQNFRHSIPICRVADDTVLELIDYRRVQEPFSWISKTRHHSVFAFCVFTSISQRSPGETTNFWHESSASTDGTEAWERTRIVLPFSNFETAYTKAKLLVTPSATDRVNILCFYSEEEHIVSNQLLLVHLGGLPLSAPWWYAPEVHDEQEHVEHGCYHWRWACALDQSKNLVKPMYERLGKERVFEE